MTAMAIYEAHARELLGMPEDWRADRYEVPEDDAAAIVVCGAVDRWPGSSVCARFSIADHAAWAARHGTCLSCGGTRKVVAGERNGVTIYRECKECDASGKNLKTLTGEDL